MPRKFDQNAKDRMIRLVEDRILAENMSMAASKLGVSWHTVRQWTPAVRREGRVVQPQPEDLVVEEFQLRRENPALRDTKQLLKAASAFSRRQHRPETKGNDPLHTTNFGIFSFLSSSARR